MGGTENNLGFDSLGLHGLPVLFGPVFQFGEPFPCGRFLSGFDREANQNGMKLGKVLHLSRHSKPHRYTPADTEFGVIVSCDR